MSHAMSFVAAMSIVMVLALVSLVEGFPSGAPVEACGRLQPRHLASPSDGRHSPYYFSASGSSYGRDYHDPIKVAIRGEIFKGFIIAAIDPHTHKRIGKWMHTDGTQTLPCAAVTHTNSKPKKQVVVYWQPPFGHSGDVVFEATIVQHYSSYYSNLIAEVESGDSKHSSPPRHSDEIPFHQALPAHDAPVHSQNSNSVGFDFRQDPSRFFQRFGSYKK